ncbi:uncharacterized protein [Rutidosis leptorrhynchoides]|uniref:uncharacterized protein n=1 Tax=Rutidosis leptorrhynchoides TaxID=125765 RepID=UPI003A99424A
MTETETGSYTQSIETPPTLVEQRAHIHLDELEEGKDAEVMIMVCHRWDPYTAYGKYLSTDFIVSDKKGTVIQCTAKNNIAHCYIPRLIEGSVYLIGNFQVIRNKEEYRVLKDNPLMIELHGPTYLRRQVGNDNVGFIHHPYSCIDFEDLEVTGGKYLVDVIGYALNVVNVKTSRSGSLSISSSSPTWIMDDPEIPALQAFKSKVSGKALAEVLEDCLAEHQLGSPKEVTLAELLDLARQRKLIHSNAHFILPMFIPKVAGTILAAAFAALGREYRVRVTSFGVFLMKKRFRLQFDVTDDSVATVIILFDETAEQIVNGTAQSLLTDMDKGSCTSVLPNALVNLVNTTHTFLLKPSSYYEYGSYKSFNCIKVFTAGPDHPDSSPGTKQLPRFCDAAAAPATSSLAKTTEVKSSTPTGQKRNLHVATPAKELERPRSHKFVVESSDSDDGKTIVEAK